MQEQKVYLGPPGTGKTTKLIKTVADEMTNGVPPDRIAFVSFTKKASDEAAERACEKFKLDRRDLPYFRTLHSIAFRELGLRRGDVIGKTQYNELSNLLGVEFSGYYKAEDGLSGGHDGDKLLFLQTLSRTRLVSLKEQWNETDVGIGYDAALQFHNVYNQYREDIAMLDYTDFLEYYLKQQQALNVEVAIIDEAQDLSSLQWEVARLATRNAKRVYIAGDDDQAIYQWSGANVKYFLGLEGQKIVLDRSYRLPASIFTVADKIVNNINERYKKVWQPRDEVGEVLYHSDAEYIDFDSYDGDWLLLARNNYFLPRLKDLVTTSGLIYNFRGKNSVDQNHVLGIKTWERLRAGGSVEPELVQVLFDLTKTKQQTVGMELYNKDELINMFQLNLNEPWYLALVGIHERTRNYYRSILARGKSLTDLPEAIISAIHGAKGGEADNVLLLTDMSYSSHTELENNPDTEHRVFYVGATRARKRLHIVSAQTNKYYKM